MCCCTLTHAGVFSVSYKCDKHPLTLHVRLFGPQYLTALQHCCCKPLLVQIYVSM